MWILKSTDSLLSHQVVAEYGGLFLLHRRELHPLVHRDFEKKTFPTQSCWLMFDLLTGIYLWTALSLSVCEPPAWWGTITETLLANRTATIIYCYYQLILSLCSWLINYYLVYNMLLNCDKWQSFLVIQAAQNTKVIFILLNNKLLNQVIVWTP